MLGTMGDEPAYLEMLKGKRLNAEPVNWLSAVQCFHI